MMTGQKTVHLNLIFLSFCSNTAKKEEDEDDMEGLQRWALEAM